MSPLADEGQLGAVPLPRSRRERLDYAMIKQQAALATLKGLQDKHDELAITQTLLRAKLAILPYGLEAADIVQQASP